jgi:Uma2 family endonuclease
MRIFTDINISKERGDYQLRLVLQVLFCGKMAACRRNDSVLSLSMSQPYEETLDGATLPRSAPGERHEIICERLHREMAVSVAGLATTQLLAPRTKIQISRTTTLCPDLALVTAATGKLFLAVEIVSRDDHNADTFVKKEVYEKIRVPRLWMIDPRYDNVEIYHTTEFGLALKGILAGKEVLAEKLIPEFQIVIAELFATELKTS